MVKVERNIKLKRTLRKTANIVLGIDEVGRGPLAGPVTLCISKIEKAKIGFVKRELQRLAGKPYPVGKDSKKMTHTEREFWYGYLNILNKEKKCTLLKMSASAKQIDTKGVAVCIQQIVDTLVGRAIGDMDPMCFELRADAGLKTKRNICRQKDVVHGDEKEFVISIASVYAKVTRDRYMTKIGKKGEFAAYGFDIHKGYGTEKHRAAITTHGLSREHRKSFCRNFTDLE